MVFVDECLHILLYYAGDTCVEFIDQPHDVHVNQGDNALFPCMYSLDSLPYWNINGAEILSSDLPINHEYNVERGLIVRNVSYSMNLWQYSCLLYLFSPQTGRIERCESRVGKLYVHSNRQNGKLNNSHFGEI